MSQARVEREVRSSSRLADVTRIALRVAIVADSASTPLVPSVLRLVGNVGSNVLSQVLAPTNAVLSHIGTDRTAHAGTSHTGGAQLNTDANQAADQPATQVAKRTGSVTERPHGAVLGDEDGVGTHDPIGTVADLVAPLHLDRIL